MTTSLGLLWEIFNSHVENTIANVSSRCCLFGKKHHTIWYLIPFTTLYRGSKFMTLWQIIIYFRRFLFVRYHILKYFVNVLVFTIQKNYLKKKILKFLSPIFRIFFWQTCSQDTIVFGTLIRRPHKITFSVLYFPLRPLGPRMGPEKLLPNVCHLSAISVLCVSNPSVPRLRSKFQLSEFSWSWTLAGVKNPPPAKGQTDGLTEKGQRRAALVALGEENGGHQSHVDGCFSVSFWLFCSAATGPAAVSRSGRDGTATTTPPLLGWTLQGFPSGYPVPYRMGTGVNAEPSVRCPAGMPCTYYLRFSHFYLSVLG